MNTSTPVPSIAAPSPRVRLTRLDFYADYQILCALKSACAFHNAWKLAVEYRGSKLQRTILRNWMRISATEAVKRARKIAERDAAELRRLDAMLASLRQQDAAA